MFDIGCVTCRYRISEGSMTAFQATYNTYLLQCRVIVLDQCEVIKIKHLKITSQQLIAN